MGMSTGGKPGAVKSDINVTPLVDVVLVLLIIFIVTMPVMMHTESLEVPRSADENELPDTSKQVIVTYRPDGTVVLSDGQNSENDKKIQATSLVMEVSDRLKEKTGDKVVFVDFCDHTPWSDVVQTMDVIRSLATDKNHNDIRVALKKREKQSDIRDEQAAGTYKDPCQ